MDQRNGVPLLRAILCFAALFAFSCAFAPLPASGFEIEHELMSKMTLEGSQGYLIYFHERADLAKASDMEWKERGEFVANALRNTSDNTQSRVRNYLDRQGVQYRSFWITNVIVVESSDKAVLEGLANFSEIESIRTRRLIPAPAPDLPDTAERSIQAIETNLTYIKADQAWALGYDGAGMTVGVIDSGVRYTHKALTGKYRGNLGSSFDHNYNWWDPGSRCGGAPCDLTSHGTHVAGIIVGDDSSGNQIGVAPGAKWIACQACDADGCPDEYLFSCGQFMLAPTDSKGNNPDPSKRPHVINNSWNGPSPGDKFFWSIAANWRAAGIHPVFANGNAGPGCSTAGSPGDYPMVTSVGNIDHTTGLPAEKSSRGPSIFENTINPMGYPYLKPLISAPGMNIRSSYYTGDDNYIAKSGTSMAAPHTAGLVALILQAAPCLTYAQVEKLLVQTATPISYVSGCGTEGPGGVPNNATGWGVINAYAAVQKILGICGGMGGLQGTVTSRSGEPVQGALVTTGSRLTAVTNANGRYALPRLSARSQTIIVSALGYYGKTETISVSGNITTTADFVMEPKPKVTVRGKVTDGSGGGWPLYATVSASSDRSDVTTSTDPVTGLYALAVPADTVYAFAISSTGYTTGQRTLTVTSRSMTQDFSLTVDRACSAPGYEDIRVLYEEFEGTFPPSGWTTVPYVGTSDVWHRNDHFNTPNQTNGSGYCAQAGAEEPSTKWDAGLVSPPIDLPAEGVATLLYENRFWSTVGNFAAWVEVSTDGGTLWHTLTEYTKTRGPLLEQVDLAGYAGKTVQIRWRYSTQNYWGSLHQQIDNVKVSTGCRLKSNLGGLVVGHMYDTYTGKPVTEEIVVTNDLSQTASTDASGLFVLFSSAGTRTITAKPSPGSGYGSSAQRVDVRAGGIVQKNFRLPAGKLGSSPEKLRVTLSAGSRKTATLRLVNRGGKEASFWLTTAISGTGAWLTVSPDSGAVAARKTTPIAVTFDSAGLPSGTYEAEIRVANGTPYGAFTIPVTMIVGTGSKRASTDTGPQEER
jgi:subtilisin family serine protease